MNLLPNSQSISSQSNRFHGQTTKYNTYESHQDHDPEAATSLLLGHLRDSRQSKFSCSQSLLHSLNLLIISPKHFHRLFHGVGVGRLVFADLRKIEPDGSATLEQNVLTQIFIARRPMRALIVASLFGIRGILTRSVNTFDGGHLQCGGKKIGS